MNASLGGAGSQADQIVVNGEPDRNDADHDPQRRRRGRPDQRRRHPAHRRDERREIASDAFALASYPVVGGFRYTLDETDGDWYLVSSATTTQGQVQTSVNSVAKAQQAPDRHRPRPRLILLGATQQISCSSCGSGFASFGSLALGMQGRWTLSPTADRDRRRLLQPVERAGDLGHRRADRRRRPDLRLRRTSGSSRPFFQAGGGITPYESVSTRAQLPLTET